MSLHLQHSDNVITQLYTGMTEEGRSDVFAAIDGDKVKVVPKREAGFKITFDKTEASVTACI